MSSTNVRWSPLESNPETMTSYINTLGVKNGWIFSDVYGVDPDLLCLIPKPCCAFILLFPITETYKSFCIQENDTIEKNGQTISSNVFYMKQTIGNACGTIGVIHALGNSKDKILLEDNSVFKNFFDKVEGLSPENIGKTLESDTSFTKAHTDAAQSGETPALSAETPVDLHFVALVHKDGSLYELDGRKNFPINHGPTSEVDFVSDAAAVCKKFMARDPTELRFTILALSKLE